MFCLFHSLLYVCWLNFVDWGNYYVPSKNVVRGSIMNLFFLCVCVCVNRKKVKLFINVKFSYVKGRGHYEMQKSSATQLTLLLTKWWLKRLRIAAKLWLRWSFFPDYMSMSMAGLSTIFDFMISWVAQAIWLVHAYDQMDRWHYH